MAIYDFREKVVLVTGGSRGIGKTISLEFAKAGAEVYIVSKKHDQDFMDLKNLNIKCVQADLSIPEVCKQIITQIIDEKGDLDVLINNAAVFLPSDTFHISLSDWDETLRVNVMAIFECSKYFALNKKNNKSSGSIVNISSTSSKLAVPSRLAYSISKAMVNSLTRSMAIEWAKYNIRVNAVAPGHTSTEGIIQAIEDKILDDSILDPIPLKRLGSTLEIAKAVLFLSSNEASYISGHTLMVDGGRSINWVW